MSMIDLRKDFHFAINNISSWKNSYECKVYVHRKLLINIMFRAINTKFVYDAFKRGEMINSLDLEESIEYVEDFYKGMAENVMPNLIGWLRNMSNDDMVGTVNYHFYKCLAYDAEIKDDSMRELEYIYVFEQLNDVSILFYTVRRDTPISAPASSASFDVNVSLSSANNFLVFSFVIPHLAIVRILRYDSS